MKLLDIRPDEQGKVLMFAVLLFIRSAGKVIGWAAVQAIIIKRLGLETLPYSFVLFAILGMIGSLLYIFFADAVRRDVLLKIYCGATGILLFLSMFFLPAYTPETTTLSTGFIIFSCLILAANGLGDETIGIQIWTIINDTFRPSQGVRLYPIITTASLLGGIAGGVALQGLVEFPLERFIPFWGLTILTGWPIMVLLQHLYGQTIWPESNRERSFSYHQHHFWHNLRDGYRFAIRSSLVHCIAGICILFWTVASLKEFQYSQILHVTFPSAELLSKYYGYYTILLNISVLLLQLTVTGRIIKIIGVGFGLWLLPVTIFIGLTLIILSYSFLSAFVMRYTWDVMAMTLQGSCYQLSFNAIPAPYRGRVRGLLEGVVNPIGGILGGTIVIVKNHFTPAVQLALHHQLIFTVLGLWFSLVWIFVAMAAEKQYHRAILQNLSSSDDRTLLDAKEMLVETQISWSQRRRKA